MVKLPILGSDAVSDKVAERRAPVYDRITWNEPFTEDPVRLMNRVTVELLLYSSLLTLLLAALAGVIWAWIWALRRLWMGHGLLENVRPSTLGESPWGAMTVFAVVFLYALINISVTHGYSAVTGRHLPKTAIAAEKKGDTGKPGTEAKRPEEEKERPNAVVGAGAKPGEDRAPGPRPEGLGETEQQSEAELLIQLAIVNVLLLILVPMLVRLTSNATPSDLGLVFHNWKGQMAVGAVAALLMTPAVLAIQSLAIKVWPSHKHPVEDMILEEFTPGNAIVAVLSAMVLAPMIEELLFRAIVQRWLTGLCSGVLRSLTWLCSGALRSLTWLCSGVLRSLTWLFSVRRDLAASPGELDRSEPVSDDWRAREDPLQHLAELNLGSAADRLPPSLTPMSSVTAIVLTSLLFATMHLPQWPAPIGIFLLALALGAVYQKTGSLISVITMHAVFNGFSTVGLLLMALERDLHPNHVGAIHALITDVFGIVRVTVGSSG
jgi:membrane protease YdiL (CAAX protease family)